MSETSWVSAPTAKKCVTCGSFGFMTSPLGKDRCSFCDGTEGGTAPTLGDCADRIEELEEMLMSATMDGYDMAKNEYRSYIEELEAQLRKSALQEISVLGQEIEVTAELEQAEAKIVELEVKLAKAMEHVADYSNDPHLVEWANATIAELKGETK